MSTPLEVDDRTRQKVTAHYDSNAEQYAGLWETLDEIGYRVQSARPVEMLPYLKLAYIHSVFTIQTRVSEYERAVGRLMDGEPLEDAITSVLYHQQKLQSIRETLPKESAWMLIASALDADHLTEAHELTLAELKHVGVVKAPFMLALLGYTEKMCIDINVARTFGWEETPSDYTVSEYESLCSEACDAFPDLSARIDPFHLQWVIFDWYRYSRSQNEQDEPARRTVDPVSPHDGWLTSARKDHDELAAILRTAT